MDRRRFLGWLPGLLGLAMPAVAEAPPEAKRAVDAWLAAHDDGRYAETWKTAARLVRQKITQENWEKVMRSVMEPLGKVKTRSLVSTKQTSELPGAPVGRYVVFEFRTSFEKRPSVVETVVPMMESGTWKVMTYRVR